MTPATTEGSDQWAQLATRIPKHLHRDVKLHCIRTESTITDFVIHAIREKLGVARLTPRRPRKPPPG